MRPGGKVAILVAAAIEGTYTEIWNLPTGATFRISGRPHQMVHWRFCLKI